MTRILTWAGLAVTLSFLAASTARASESLQFSVSLKPERLGQSTTVGFNFIIVPHGSPVPPPLTEVDLRYPGDIGVALSGLGLATCPVSTLEVIGPNGCPAEARMGFGRALAEIEIAEETIEEQATIAVLRATTQEGHISMYFWAEGHTPVEDNVLFPGALLPAQPPFGGRLHIDVPLVEALPDGPYVSVAQIHGTLGPEHLTYFRRVKHGFAPYNPRGILLPKHCPHSGFRFTAELGFLDGTKTSAEASVPCPRR